MTSFGNLIAVGLFIIGPAVCEKFDPILVKKCNDDCEQSYGLAVLEHGQDVPIKIAEMKRESGKPKCTCALNGELLRIVEEANLDVNSFNAHETDYWEMTQWLKDHGFKLRTSQEVCDQGCLQEGGYIKKKKESEHEKKMSGGKGKEKSHTNSPGKKGRKVMFQHGKGEAESRLHKSGHEEVGKDGNQQEESRHVPLKTGHLQNIRDGKGECKCRYRDEFYSFLEQAGCDVAAFKEREDNSTKARDWLKAKGFSVSVIQAHRQVYEVEKTYDVERECDETCQLTQGWVGFKISRFKKDGYGRKPIAIGLDENDPSETQSLKMVIPKGWENQLECNCKINPEVHSHLETLKIVSDFEKKFFKGKAKGCNWLWKWNILKMKLDVECPKKTG